MNQELTKRRSFRQWLGADRSMFLSVFFGMFLLITLNSIYYPVYDLPGVGIPFSSKFFRMMQYILGIVAPPWLGHFDDLKGAGDVPSGLQPFPFLLVWDVALSLLVAMAAVGWKRNFKMEIKDNKRWG